MRSDYLDEDTLGSVFEALDLIKCYKLMHERVEMPDIAYGDVIEISDDTNFYLEKYDFLKIYSEFMFDGYSEYIEVNNPDEEISKEFDCITDAFDYDDIAVDGIIISHPALLEFFRLCEKHNVKIDDSIYCDKVCHIDRSTITRYDSYESYFEVFIPDSDVLMYKYPLCMFYTDASLFNSNVLGGIYDLIDTIMDIVTHPQFNKDMLIKGL